MKRNALIIIILIFVYGCSSSKQNDNKRCKSLFWNGFKRIVVEERKSIIENDTIIVNEVRYECIKNIMQSTKVMYDNFGVWDEIIFLDNQNFEIFLWKNIELIPNENIRFDIATSGNENYETIYTSVMVLGKNNLDYLSSSSKYKTKLIAYFGDLIKSNNSKNKEFYKKYWQTVNPKQWEKIRKNFEK